MGKIYDLVKSGCQRAALAVAVPAVILGAGCGDKYAGLDEEPKVEHVEYETGRGSGKTTFKLEEDAKVLFENYLHLRRLQGEGRFSRNDISRLLYVMDTNGDQTLEEGEVKSYVKFERKNLKGCMDLTSTDSDRSCD